MISTKEEAYNYLVNVNSGAVESTPELHDLAKSFFSDEEFACTVFRPLFNINDCFPGVARDCENSKCSHD